MLSIVVATFNNISVLVAMVKQIAVNLSSSFECFNFYTNIKIIKFKMTEYLF